jgi:4-hydroxybenzoyl-CoA thioesterase/acyl-CoA thioester hydrolase
MKIKEREVIREFTWPLRVYIEDTDAGGIVYYVNYLKYMERARTESMRVLGFGKQFIFDQQVMFVVHSLQVDYRKPARLDDQLDVTANIVKIGRTYLVFEQRVCRQGEELCLAQVKIACVDKQTVKPAAIPEQILDRLP